MRFRGERQVPAPLARVWSGLHDGEVLRAAVPGCEELVPLGTDRYAATLAARVGPVCDTYEGTFSIEDDQESALRVLVDARGRCGRLSVDLRVTLSRGPVTGTTTLRYDADAAVSGFVSRLGGAALSVAGGHFTGCFFRDLDRSLREPVRTAPLSPV